MDNDFRIEEKENINLPIQQQGDAPKNPIEQRTDAIAEDIFEGYQAWSEERNHDVCDLYRLDRQYIEFHLIEDPENQEISANQEIAEFHLVEDSGNQEISQLEVPKKGSLLSLGTSSLKYVGLKVISYGSSFFVNPFKTSSVSPISDQKGEIILKPSAKKSYELVLKLVPVDESRKWKILLNCLPENVFSVLEEELNKLIKCLEGKIKALNEGKDFTFLFEMTTQIYPLIDDNLMAPEELCKGESPQRVQFVLTDFLNELKDRIEIIVVQPFTDPFLNAVYSPDMIKKRGLSTEATRHFNRLENFKMLSKKSTNPSLRFLVENGFVSHTPSVFRSVEWEMEFGQKKGASQQIFQKGYCKCSFAILDKDIREIRIPIDLRAMKLSSVEEAHVLFLLIQEAAGKDQDKISSYCTKENLLTVLENKCEAVGLKKIEPFLKKCIHDENTLKELQKMLTFTNIYVKEMMEKASISLGREYLHFDGVVSLFEVFPNMLIKNQCHKSKEFKVAYEDFLCALHEVGQQDVLDLDKLMDAQGKLMEHLDLAEMSKEQQTAVSKYLNYLMGLTLGKEESNFTQIPIAEKTSTTWKEVMGLEEWPKGMEKEVFQLMMDPATCRQVAEYVRYSDLVKKENERQLKENGVIIGNAFHQMKLQSLCVDLIEKILLRVEPLKKEELITLAAKLFFAASDPTLSQEELNAIEVPKDLSALKEMLQRWEEEDFLSPTSDLDAIDSNMPSIHQLKLLKELFIKKVMDLLPHEMPQEEKKIMDLEIKKFLDLQGDDEIHGLREVIKFLETMKFEKRKEIFTHSLPFNFIIRNEEMIQKVDFSGILPESYGHLPMDLFFQMLGTPNPQIAFDPYELPIFHPSYIKITQKGHRQLYYWDPKIQQEDMVGNGKKSVWQKILVKDRYQHASEGNYANQRISWHMEMGEELPETNEKIKDIEIQKKSRLFKNGYAEISLAVPTWGDCRSCRAYLDLSPFELNDIESLQEVLECIFLASGKSDPQKTKQEFMEFIESVKDNKKFSSLCNQKDLFIRTGLQYIHSMYQALSKVYLSIGESNVHFDDVEEIGGLIPQHMLEEIFLTRPKMKVVWEDYLKAVGKVRDLRVKEYLLGEKADPEKLILFDKGLKKAFNNLIWWIHGDSISYGVFTNKEDQQVVKSYINEMQIVATNPWDKENFALKMMERSVKNIAGMEDIQDEKELLGLRLILFPLLVDTHSLRVFNDWMRALEVARKGTGEFHDQRLGKKKLALMDVVKDRSEMSMEEKNKILEWIEKIKSPGK